MTSACSVWVWESAVCGTDDPAKGRAYRTFACHWRASGSRPARWSVRSRVRCMRGKYNAPHHRLWEGFFADAYGTGEAAYHTVKGLQDAGTMATAKHLIGYEQETFR